MYVILSVRLRPKPNRPTHLRWVNVSTILSCPAGLHNSSIWYSSREVYKMTVGCQNEEEPELRLQWFPDVQNITARFISQITNLETRCIFSSNDGILKGELIPETPISGPLNEIHATIFIQPGQKIQHEFFICKQGVVRNGTCRTQYANGTYGGGKQSIQTSGDQHKITDELRPSHLDKHQ
ncbi:hypothetical protein D915_009946 [Fasciola hepatica]|uniref:Uncharacterized protein n=1 Tax=Fasciola hepatica TaxID=6192 RepID=A0A4E0QW94_FASHE|nr:hypothetical protein D915_009946 [Fasciola hepatica]